MIMDLNSVKNSFHTILEGKQLKDKFAIFVYKLERLFLGNRPVSLIYPVTIKNTNGIYFCGNNVSALEIAKESYEKELAGYFKLARGKTFIDVGANIGHYTIMLANANRDSQIFAIEPEKRNLNILRENARLNKLRNCTIIPLVAYKKRSKLVLYNDMGGKNEGSYSIVKSSARAKKERVSADKLDNMSREFGIKNVGLIKIDVEGAEEDVVKGALMLLRRYRPNIILEVWDNKRFSSMYDRYFKRLKYRFKRLDSTNYFLYAFSASNLYV